MKAFAKESEIDEIKRLGRELALAWLTGIYSDGPHGTDECAKRIVELTEASNPNSEDTHEPDSAQLR